ncbi:MAG: right-handed parallel beta-helix repeat-containing protein [Bacteroidia bacterium]|nr:right-handed parallel beta-helix repeat-containing protein [Bacteroidia bacterium]
MRKQILFTIVFGAALAVHSKTYYISNSGKDSNNGLSTGLAFLTIQKATDMVVAGDSILVADGNYTGFNHMNKANGTSSDPIVYMATGKNVWITTPKYNNNGINIENNNYVEVIGFNIKKMLKEGIRAVTADHITIRNNYCDSCYRGIFTGFTDYLTVENNVCRRSHGEHGIYVSNNSDNAVVRYNVCSYNTRSGIQFNPDISSGAPGISVNSTITHNIIFENKTGAGLNLQGLDGAIVANNLIYNNRNSSGITLFHGDAAAGCKNVKVYNNTIIVPADGRWALHVIDDASNITIYNNILINLHSWKGAIALEKETYTQTGIVSNYNVVSDKFCDVDDGCSKNLATWEGYGYDQNSILAPALTALFADANNNDYHLKSGAVAVNAGTAIVSTDVTNDRDMKPRPIGGTYDIGCYEYDPSTGTYSVSKKNNYFVIRNENEITIANISASDEVQVFDIEGRLIHTGSIWNTDNVTPGIYFFRVLSARNELLGAEKIIVSH